MALDMGTAFYICIYMYYVRQGDYGLYITFLHPQLTCLAVTEVAPVVHVLDEACAVSLSAVNDVTDGADSCAIITVSRVGGFTIARGLRSLF